MPAETGPPAARQQRKRSITMAAAKKAKIESDYRRVLNEDKESKSELMICEIVQHLQAHPEKIADCHDALVGNMFDASINVTAVINSTYVYLYKLPVPVIESLFSEPDPSFDKGLLRGLAGIDRNIRYKMLYRCSLTDKSTLTPSHDVAQCIKIISDRCSKVAFPLDSFAGLEDNKVDWRKLGVYTTEPDAPPEGHAEAAPWQVTRIIINGTLKIALAGSGTTAMSDWMIVDNESIKKATLCSPPGGTISTSKPCHEIFAGQAAFQSFFESFSFKAIALGSAQGGASSASGSGAAAPARPAEGRRQLSSKHRQAVQAIQKM